MNINLHILHMSFDNMEDESIKVSFRHKIHCQQFFNDLKCFRPLGEAKV